jgi:hypothetical protein
MSHPGEDALSRAVGTGCDQLDGRGRCILALYRSAAQPTMARLGSN